MSKIKVALRVRPLSEREKSDGYPVIASIEDNSVYITDIRVPENPSADSRQRFRKFDFDHCFSLDQNGGGGSSQKEIYDEMGPSLEKSILEGLNVCLIAYGQSGSGKTYTMLGNSNNEEEHGLIPRMCKSIWRKLQDKSVNQKAFKMEVSYIEIYREKVKDLLHPSKKHLKVRESPTHGNQVQGITKIEVNEEISLVEILWEGEKMRSIGTTNSNTRSSRSHAIFSWYFTFENDDNSFISNQVHLVDLAGSEKAAFCTNKNLLAEGSDINKSLVSLGNVISSLAEKASFIPYRDSTLTWLLKDSIGGNSTTNIIITASPSSSNFTQTLNSLRFGQRANLIENQPKINFSSIQQPTTQLGSFLTMSHNEIKKDISRLANLIKTAQNGGILKNLKPKNSWNKLIATIEGWTPPAEASRSSTNSTNLNKRRTVHRAPSEEASTMTSESLNSLISSSRNKLNSNSSSASVPSSPTKRRQRSDSFTSQLQPSAASSIKCLTWKQEEITKIHEMETTSDSESEKFLSPPITPKLYHSRHVFPVHYPRTSNLDRESRVSERISREIDRIDFYNVTPQDTHALDETILISHKPPALVNPLTIDEKECLQSPTKCTTQFYKMMDNLVVSPMESADDDEVFEPQEFQQNPQMVYKGFSSKNCTQPDTEATEEPVYFSTESTESESSYESINVNRDPPRVKIVQKSSINFPDECVRVIDPLKILKDRANHCVSAVCYDGFGGFCEPEMCEKLPSPCGAANMREVVYQTKFRNRFQREYQQIEKIGKEIKSLQALSERYKMMRPYLDQIDELNKIDFTKSTDKNLDDEIEKCSGWDVSIEMRKVQKDFTDIKELLNKKDDQKMQKDLKKKVGPSVLQKKLSGKKDLTSSGDSTRHDSSSTSSSSYNSLFEANRVRPSYLWQQPSTSSSLQKVPQKTSDTYQPISSSSFSSTDLDQQKFQPNPKSSYYERENYHPQNQPIREVHHFWPAESASTSTSKPTIASHNHNYFKPLIQPSNSYTNFPYNPNKYQSVGAHQSSQNYSHYYPPTSSQYVEHDQPSSLPFSAISSSSINPYISNSSRSGQSYQYQSQGYTRQGQGQELKSHTHSTSRPPQVSRNSSFGGFDHHHHRPSVPQNHPSKYRQWSNQQSFNEEIYEPLPRSQTQIHHQPPSRSTSHYEGFKHSNSTEFSTSSAGLGNYSSSRNQPTSSSTSSSLRRKGKKSQFEKF